MRYFFKNVDQNGQFNSPSLFQFDYVAEWGLKIKKELQKNFGLIFALVDRFWFNCRAICSQSKPRSKKSSPK